MRIISLNVWGGKQDKLFFDFLEKYSKSTDIFCFQEVFTGAHTEQTMPFPGVLDYCQDRIYEALPEYTFFTTAARFEGEELQTIAVKNGTSASNHLTATVYQNTKRQPNDPPSNDSVIMQSLVVATESGPITIAQVHGYWEQDEGEDKPARTEQTDNILKFIQTIKTPIVLCGDFNTNWRTQSIARLSENLQNLIAKSGVETTRPAFCKYHGTIADYAFVSPEIPVKTFEVLQSEASDHLPLLIEIA